MKHAGEAALDTIEDLLAAARSYRALTERKRGIFYRKSVAWLHFHEDPAGMFADLKGASGWSRMRVTTAAEKRRFVAALQKSASGTP
jgi:DNA-binding transcriptional MocR family regulator